MYVGCACGCGCEGGRAVTQAERHSQAKDNAVCVCVCVCVHMCTQGGWCVASVWPVGAGCVWVCMWCVGRDRGRETQPGKGQRRVCVYVWLVCRAMCVRGCVWCV